MTLTTYLNYRICYHSFLKFDIFVISTGKCHIMRYFYENFIVNFDFCLIFYTFVFCNDVVQHINPPHLPWE